MKSKRQKSIENPRSHYWLKKADTAWGQYVHAHFSRCAVNNADCAGRLEAHHLINRAIKASRHDPANAILLCSVHHKFSNHLSPHGAPLEFAEWLRVNLLEKWEWVQQNKNNWKTIKADYKQAYANLVNIQK